ncbi:hypothetical protein GN330_04595 [Nitratireductor sp. CAU 1489]|uniref:Uncharacterized protein n=1 Tax=Nitratireductor arenosus TaxID=2682096 RepID=A0A844Q8V7_9HYPH|nr:hypothetical protein [Nitratireductor arenosus]MVA96526.1 hypothetical protein [Nitratireductor arenosus]
MKRSDIVTLASEVIFGKSLIMNVYRSIVVEAIISRALPDWTWCSSDYASHDFERNGIRLEVKQTAIRQTWTTTRLSRPSWDIAPRKGYWLDGKTWIPSPGRNAELYLLGLHAIADDTADHRDPEQWRFFVIATSDLPPTNQIGLRKVEQLASFSSVTGLAAKVDEILSQRRVTSTREPL